jgi:hypothetical protein
MFKQQTNQTQLQKNSKQIKCRAICLFGLIVVFYGKERGLVNETYSSAQTHTHDTQDPEQSLAVRTGESRTETA